MLRDRARDWFRRYAPAECVSLVGALVAANLVFSFSGSVAAAAVAGALGENLGYYGVMLVREVRASRRLLLALRDLLIEFGPAELIDSAIIRPLCMYGAARLVADVSLGILIGKVVADVTFYVPVILAYELRRRYLPASRATTGANVSMTRSNTIT